MMVSARLVSRVIDLASMLILARLLTPQDFGLVAIAMTIVLILEAALELPLSQALVRMETIEDCYYDTAFTLALLRGVILCAAVAVIAAPFAGFYKHSNLVPLIVMLSIGPAARGMMNPRMAEFAKNLNFKYEFMFELAGKFAAFCIGLTVALLTHSYWSIAAGAVAAPLVISTLSYAMFPFRPRLTLAHWRVFGDFLGWVSLSQVVLAINWQSDQLLLGKLLPATRLGMFSLANNLTNIPVTALFSPLLRPMLSAFTMLRNDKERLGESYINAATACIAIGLPLLVGQSLVADPMVRLLLGGKWIPAIPMVQWLAVSLIPWLWGMLVIPLSMALGQTRTMVSRNLLEMLVKLPLVIIGAIKFGFAGVIGARLISETISAFYCMIIIRRLSGLTVARQLLSCWRPAVATAMMAAFLLAANPLLGWGASPLALAAELGVKVSLGALAYSGCLLLLWRLSGNPPGIEAIGLRMAGNVYRRGAPEVIARPH
jgi:O-antigen/teichoic acid export membrane protein